MDPSTFDPSKHNNFLVAHGPFENTPNFINKKPWSPIVWHGGRRAKSNFLSASLVALDFDSGEWTLEDGIQYALAANLSTVIATTKSHRKEKNGQPACDRFRMVIAAEQTTSLDDFEYTMKVFMTEVPCDKSCKDGGRFYFPCRELVWQKFDGNRAKWLTCPYEETHEAKELAFGDVDPEDMRNLGALPHYVWTYIAYGSKTERHKAAYIVACEMANYGFTEPEILGLLVKHKSPLLNIGEGKDDVRRCIANGAAKVEQRRGRQPR